MGGQSFQSQLYAFVACAGLVLLGSGCSGVLDSQSRTIAPLVTPVNPTPTPSPRQRYTIGTSANDLSYSSKIDSAGFSYHLIETQGEFEGGDTSFGGTDFVVVKRSVRNDRIWATRFGSVDSDFPISLEIDEANQRIFAIGYTAGAPYASLPNQGGLDLVLVAFDLSTGAQIDTIEWQLGTASDDVVTASAITSDGDLIITGFTSGSLFDNSQCPADGGRSGALGGQDLFLLKLDPDSGSFAYRCQHGTPGDDKPRNLLLREDSTEEVFLVGETFGSFPAFTNAGSGTIDGIVLRYTNGALDFTEQRGTADNESFRGAAITTSGNLYVGGSTTGSMDGNPSQGMKDGVVVHYSPTLIHQRTVQVGTERDDQPWDLAVDTSGFIYLLGWTGGQIGPISYGERDGFILKFNFMLEVTQRLQFGSSGEDQAFRLLMNPNNSRQMLVTGVTKGEFYTSINHGRKDVFEIEVDLDLNLIEE